jgi:type VI secretion system protein VasD
MRKLRTMPIVFLWAGCAALIACSTPPPKPQPVNLKLNLTASADVNPDAQNRPSPVVIRIYQLKDDAGFKGADFFVLYDKEEATLAAALVSRVEFELAPGEKKIVDYSVSPDTRFIGVAAAYRDIRNAQWRAESGTVEKGVADLLKKNKIAIAVNRARVSFAD